VQNVDLLYQLRMSKLTSCFEIESSFEIWFFEFGEFFFSSFLEDDHQR
jgi:hypothetical protein